MEGTFATRSGAHLNLHVDGEQFAASVHGDLDCTTCHLLFVDNPPDPPDADIDEEILTLSKEIARKSPVDPIAQAACIQCHDDVYAKFRASVHGVNIFEKHEVDGPICVDCHGSPHQIAPRGAPHKAGLPPSKVAYENIVATCGRCHEQKRISLKYGFSTEIIARYDESFHGKKYQLGGKNLPVCTTCHGDHDIRSQHDPKARVYGANRIKLCGQCHAGANERFVAAITHKPVGRDNPIPYYAEKGLILLTFSVISACLLHVLLDLYALIRTAVQARRHREDR
jgi:5-methylcytosine-specific restriction endonuclease McrA